VLDSDIPFVTHRAGVHGARPPWAGWGKHGRDDGRLMPATVRCLAMGRWAPAPRATRRHRPATELTSSR